MLSTTILNTPAREQQLTTSALPSDGWVMPLAKMHKAWEAQSPESRGEFADLLERNGYARSALDAAQRGGGLKDPTKLVAAEVFQKESASNTNDSHVADGVKRALWGAAEVGGAALVVAAAVPVVAAVAVATPTAAVVTAAVVATGAAVGAVVSAIDGSENSYLGVKEAVTGEAQGKTVVEKTTHDAVVALGGNETTANVAPLAFGMVSVAGIAKTGVTQLLKNGEKLADGMKDVVSSAHLPDLAETKEILSETQKKVEYLLSERDALRKVHDRRGETLDAVVESKNSPLH